jgi:lipoprotein NlpI
LGDFIGAIENYNKALRLTPNNEDIKYNRNLAVYALRSIA